MPYANGTYVPISEFEEFYKKYSQMVTKEDCIKDVDTKVESDKLTLTVEFKQ